MIPLFDLHCDTLLCAYDSKKNIYNCNLHISLDKVNIFSPYVQVAAIWSDYRLSDDEAFVKAVNVIKFYSELGLNFIAKPTNKTINGFILGIEDAKLLNNDISRLDTLFSLGLRVLTLNWRDVSCIGGGYNTSFGLTEFGKLVVKRCAQLNIIIDLSHSSPEVFYDVLSLKNKYNFTPIASHSNSFSVCSHKRNLTDEQFQALINAKSIVGLSLVNEFLGSDSNLKNIIKHTEHFLSLGGENTLALGCDFDGTTNLPSGITSISDLSKLYSLFTCEFGKKNYR